MEKNDLIEFAQALVRTQSYSGKEDKVANLIVEHMKKWGYDSAVIDRYGSVLGCVKGKKPGKTVLIDGHIDTVPVIDNEEWKHDAFSAVIEDGKMYGRGTSDMKVSLACAIYAVAKYANETKRDFCGSIYVSCTVQEECFEGISSREISKACNPDFVIIAEASSNKVKIGQRGRAEIVLETEGVSCHSSNPEKGVNAVRSMMSVLEELEKLKPAHHPVLGDGIMCLTDIKSFPYPGSSVVPSLCRATFDRRLLTGEDEAFVIGQFYEAIERAAAKDSSIKARAYITEGEAVCYTGEVIKARRFFPAWCYDEKNETIQRIVNALSKAGLESGTDHYAFCTNGSHFCGEKGILGIGYGPSEEYLAHTRDEFIEMDGLYKAEEGFEVILKALTA